MSTPVHAGTPTGSVAGDVGHHNQRDGKKKGSKKNAAAGGGDDEVEVRSNKRQKISFGGGRKGHDD